MDIPQFRTEFPEFSDTTVYPTAMISFWSGIAEKMVLETVWATMWTAGVKLYVAHEITLAAQNKKTASFGGSPGSSGGLANSKTVGSATISYDTAAVTEKDAGWWNSTIYGRQFFRLAKIFGAGCIQL